MKTWDQLTASQQERAMSARRILFLELICKGDIKFVDPDVQEKVEEASREAEAMRTPWFVGSFVMDAIGDVIDTMVEADCQSLLYLEPHERAMDEPELEN